MSPFASDTRRKFLASRLRVPANFVVTEGRLVVTEGRLVVTEGRLVVAEGRLVVT